MIIINSGPAWFYGINSVFALVCALIAFLISMLSYRAFRFARQKRYYYLFASFLMIAFAFGLGALGGLMMHFGFYERIVSILDTFDIVFLGQMTLMLLAYTILLLVSMNVKSRRLVAFIMSLMMLFIVFSYQYYIKYHIILLLLLFFLSVNFYLNFRKNRKLNSALVFAGFYLLTIAQPFMLFTVNFSQNYYIAGQALQLAGLLSLFFMLIRVTRSK